MGEMKRALKRGKQWWESYPCDTKAEKVAGLVSACSYWHSVYRATITELEYLRDTVKWWEDEDRAIDLQLNELRAPHLDREGVPIGGSLRLEALVAEREGLLKRALADPRVRVGIEVAVEEAMRAHQEDDGSYSCDVHVMVHYVLTATSSLATRIGGRVAA